MDSPLSIAKNYAKWDKFKDEFKFFEKEIKELDVAIPRVQSLIPSNTPLDKAIMYLRELDRWIPMYNIRAFKLFNDLDVNNYNDFSIYLETVGLIWSYYSKLVNTAANLERKMSDMTFYDNTPPDVEYSDNTVSSSTSSDSSDHSDHNISNIDPVPSTSADTSQ